MGGWRRKLVRRPPADYAAAGCCVLDGRQIAPHILSAAPPTGHNTQLIATLLSAHNHMHTLSQLLASSSSLFFLFSFALISPFIFFPLHNTIIVSPMQGIFHCIFIGNSAFTFNFLYYKICSCNHLLVSSRCY